ncbi:MAG: SDR family oxidoreductase [Lachnospiraceae bacterium]|nr:SDR family oxidoreductase [Lachnospiraceae bacterium]
MGFSIKSTLKDVMADAAVAKIMDKYFPGAAESPMLKIAYSMKLSQICGFPQSGMTKEKTEALDAELQALGEGPSEEAVCEAAPAEEPAAEKEPEPAAATVPAPKTGGIEHNMAGKVAVVVGGGQKPGPGIGNGRMICLDLARHGATVVVAARHLERAQATVDMIESEGGKAWAYELDVVDRAQCEGLFKATKEKFGSVDIMVYNVGVSLEFDQQANTATLEAVNRLIDVDMVGCVWCTLECAPIMAAQESGGSIVNVSSIASKQNGTGINLGFAMYALSKAGMNKWGDISARYYAPMGVRINTLVLGPVRSVMGISDLQGLMGGISAEAADKIGDLAVMLKGGRKTVEETAHAVTFLCSDEAKFVTGLEFILDGGASHGKGPDPELIMMKAADIMAR